MARLRFTSPRSTSNWCAPGTPAPSNCWLPRTATWPICLRRRHPFELTYLGFPRERRKWMRTDDVRERANAGVERRTKGRCRSSRPSSHWSGLVGAVCLDQSDALPYAQNLMDVRSLRKGYEVARAAGGGEGAVGRAPDARGGLPSWTSLVRSRRISVDDGPGGAYATIRDTICPPCVIG